MNTFYVNKRNETSADTQLALGWAAMLQQVLRRLKKSSNGISLHNKGDSLAILLSVSLQKEELQGSARLPFLEPLISAKQDQKQAKKGRTLQDGFDYDGEREKNSQLFARLKQLPAHLRTPEARLRKEPELEAILGEGPKAELPQYLAINVMKVPDTFNEIVLRWQSLTAEQQWASISILYDLFAERENDLEAAISAWEKMAKGQSINSKSMVTAVQVINPTTGKGLNSSKSYRSPGGLDSFWLLELLKFKGFMLGSAPYVLKGSKDRKTYVILPEKVELETLTRIMDDFRRICWSSTAIKQDILAALRLTQVLVHHRRTELEISSSRGDESDTSNSMTVSTVRGFDVTMYKDMGSAHATMNVSTINVPNWFPSIATLSSSEIEEADLLLQEHIRVIRRIEGHQGKEGNDELELLRAYRDFLSGHDLQPFWHFAAFYGSYLFRQREHEKNVKLWLPQLTLKGLDLLVTNHQNAKSDLRPILDKPGFQNIASAIREATVRAQRRRSQENDNTYEVRYGLGQELMRKARYRNDFITAVSEFIFVYNAETAREEEKVARNVKRHLTTADYRQHKLRYPVTTADIDQLIELLDSYPTELVASMLVSYGYARREVLKRDEIQADTTNDIVEDVEDFESGTEED